MNKLTRNDYESMAGSSWPTYDEYVAGSYPEIEQEIAEMAQDSVPEQPIRFVPNVEYNTKHRPDNFDEQDADLVYKRQAFGLPSVKTDIANWCNVPWNSITIDQRGRVFVCDCDGHVPFPVGKVLDFDSFSAVFSSPQALEVQASVSAKQYRYCAVDFCGVRNRNKSVVPDGHIKLNISTDHSCNIHCPSCRERMMFVKDRAMLAQKFAWIERIREWIKTTDQTVVVELQGGEPFASLLYQDLIDSYLQLPNVQFVIKTNGTLIRNNHDVIARLLPKLSSINVSIDAATEHTYEQRVRLGARWPHLIEGLEFLRTLDIPVGGNFVIQRDNLHEVLPFVDFCEQYKLTPAFLILQDWGTWHNFEEQCVHLPTSADYEEFKRIVQTLKTDPRVDASGLPNYA
jgi:hypothetical protein